MNPATKLFLAAVFVVLFTSAVFSQSLAKPTLASNGGHSVISYTLTSTFLFDPTDSIKKRDKCDTSDLYDSKKKCAPVPEGGSALMYLLPAGLACLGAIALRSRRKMGAREPV